MRRLSTIVVVLAAGAAMFAATATAAHFTHGGTPTCSDIGTQLRCTGELAGLGNGDLSILVTSDASVAVNCVSPGGNESPGQNRVQRSATGSTTIPGTAIKNGRALFTTTTGAVATPTAAEAGCPNPNWSTRLVDVSFSNITLTISQAGALLFTCTAPSPGTLSCS